MFYSKFDHDLAVAALTAVLYDWGEQDILFGKLSMFNRITQYWLSDRRYVGNSVSLLPEQPSH